MAYLRTMLRRALPCLALSMAISISAWAAKEPDPVTTYLRQCVTAAKAFLASVKPDEASSLTSCSDPRLSMGENKHVTNSTITTKDSKLQRIEVKAGKRAVSYTEPKHQVRMRPSGRRPGLTCPTNATCCQGDLCCRGTYCCRFEKDGSSKCADGQT